MILFPGTVSDCLIEELSKWEKIIKVQDVHVMFAVLRDIVDKGDIVLLSPAGAGFYSKFLRNRKGFKQIVREMKKFRLQNSKLQ